MLVFISKEILHVEISTSPRGLGILYKTLLAENCQNLKLAAICRNMKFFLANKQPYFIVVFFD